MCQQDGSWISMTQYFIEHERLARIQAVAITQWTYSFEESTFYMRTTIGKVMARCIIFFWVGTIKWSRIFYFITKWIARFILSVKKVEHIVTFELVPRLVKLLAHCRGKTPKGEDKGVSGHQKYLWHKSPKLCVCTFVKYTKLYACKFVENKHI